MKWVEVGSRRLGEGPDGVDETVVGKRTNKSRLNKSAYDESWPEPVVWPWMDRSPPREALAMI